MRLKQGKGKRLRSDFRKLHCATGCGEQPAALLSAAKFKATFMDADTEGYGKVQGLWSRPWEPPM